MSGALSEKRAFRILPILLILYAGTPVLVFSQVREVSAKILADEEFRRDPGWKTVAENCLCEASADFERLFGIRMIIRGYENWASDNSAKSLDALAEDVDAHFDKHDFDLLLVMTAQENRDETLVGYTLFKEGIVFLKVTGDRPAMLRTLKHELGHVFGAVHVSDPDSVMNCFVQGDSFDALNERVIALNRERSFNSVDFPIPKHVRTQAVRVYEQIARAVRMSLMQDRQVPQLHPQAGGVFSEARLAGVLGDDGRGDPFYLDDVFVVLAQLYIESKDYDKAIQACEAALKISPKNLETQNIMGIALRREGLIDQAVEKYAGILREKPRHPRVLYNLGIACAKRGDLESARSAYAKAIEFKPNFAEAHNNLGETFLRLGTVEDAEKEFLTAASLFPGFSLAHSNLAEVLCQRKDFDRSKAEAEKAIALDPESPAARNVLGHIYYQQGKTEEAMQKYREALSLDPHYEKAYYNLGACHFDLNQVEEAKKDFEKALEVNPNFAEALASLGYCLLREHKIEEAIARIERARALGLRSAKACVNLSFAYLEKGLPDQAIREAEAAIKLDARQAPAFNNLGIAYMTEGMPERAAEQFEKALELDPNNKEALFNLGNCCFESGKTDRALGLYLKGAGIDQANGALLNNIAVIYFRKGEYALSWKYVQKAQAAGFKIHPDFLSQLRQKM
jgi:tetratricopeptide (TPR) repeat protein